MPNQSTITITISTTFLIRCGFFALPLCCFMFSLLSLWRTQALIVSTSQQIAELKLSLMSSGVATSPEVDSDPSSTPSPFVIYIPQSLFGTRSRTFEKYFTTTVNTPLEISLEELFGKDVVKSVKNFTLTLNNRTPYNGLVEISGQSRKITYIPNQWYKGFDTLSCTIQVEYEDGRVEKMEAGYKIRIRTGVVMNKVLLQPPNVYTFSETSSYQTASIKEYFEILRNNPVIPEHDTWLNRRYNTCAVVGNGGSLRGRKRGSEIDSHDVVVRINLSPIQGYEADVGSKMNISIGNGPSSYWCWKRNITGHNATYEILGQATFREQWGMMGLCPKVHPQIKYLPMNYLFVDLVDQILEEYRKIIFHETDKKFRSTGMLAVTAMAMICDHVSVYGFERGPDMENNYFKAPEKREWVGHSYLAEKAFFKDLAQGGGLFEPFLELYDLYKSFSYIVD